MPLDFKFQLNSQIFSLICTVKLFNHFIAVYLSSYGTFSWRRTLAMEPRLNISDECEVIWTDLIHIQNSQTAGGE